MAQTVAIAGAGPVGLMLAAELALAGVRTVVFDPRPRQEGFSQGMAVHGRSLELLAQRGIADKIKPEEIWAWPRTPFAFIWLDLSTVDQRDFTFALPQWRLEQVLEEWALGLGVELNRGQRVTNAVQDESGVTVTVEAAGETAEIRAAYLVGCDGRDSTVRELAGIGFPGTGWNYSGLICDVALPDGQEPKFDSGIRDGGIFGALPLRPGMVRLMTMEFDVEPKPSGIPVTVEECSSAIKRLTGSAPDIGEVLWTSRYGGLTRLAERYRSGRILIAGDAAHSIFVSGTQGLNAGLQDAMNLGWKLAATVCGCAPDGLLDSYHDERHPLGAASCRHASAQMAMLHPLGRVAPLREFFEGLTGLDSVSRYLLRAAAHVRYPMTPNVLVNGGGQHPLPGERMPDLPLCARGGATTTLAALRDGRGVLFDLSGGSHHPDADPGSFRWRDRVEIVFADPVPELPATTVLVRPDGYIAHLDPAGTDDQGLIAALRAWFGEPKDGIPGGGQRAACHGAAIVALSAAAQVRVPQEKK